jgi:hypothetical protein
VTQQGEPAQFLRQHTPEGGEHRPIRPGQSRARNLTAKDSDLMALHQDLCLLPALRPAQQHEPKERRFLIKYSRRADTKAHPPAPAEAQSMRSGRRSPFLARHRPAAIRRPSVAQARQVFLPKYPAGPLQAAPESVLGEKRLSESTVPLIISSYDLCNDEMNLFRTAHSAPTRDYRERMVDVALATLTGVSSAFLRERSRRLR